MGRGLDNEPARQVRPRTAGTFWTSEAPDLFPGNSTAHTRYTWTRRQPLARSRQIRDRTRNFDPYRMPIPQPS